MRQTLLIGDYRYPEFRSTVDWLKNNSWLALAIDADDALTRVKKQRLRPELIVIAQSHPGQFTQASVERLYRSVPLARLVTVLGGWCESETRSGHPWPGVLRMYWHQFPTRVDRDFLRGDRSVVPSWGLPRTSTDAERLLAESATGTISAERRLVVIRAAGVTAYQALADALNAEGYATMWVPPGQRPFVCGQWAGIWDSVMLSADETFELAQFAQLLHPSPLIALANFPRLSDCRRLWSAGASAVLSKPLLLSDLFSLLSRDAVRASEPVRDAFAA